MMGMPKSDKHGRSTTPASTNLDHRHALRCIKDRLEMWKRHAKRMGFPNVSAWIRKAADDAMAAESRARPPRRG